MCNLYTLDKSDAELRDIFDIRADDGPRFNTPEEMLPGYPGLVMREEEGKRILEQMVWGFPLRLKSMKPDAKPKPVNNIADLRKPMWIGLARKPAWRCLIPASRFCEAEGPKGKMTRTWFSVTDQHVFAWPGLWRVSDEWGKVYSGLMTDANTAVEPVHDRMPVILHRDEWNSWLQGSVDDLLTLQARAFPPDLIRMDRTTELWSRTSKAAKAAAQA
jgi:putative SOS response-associated peptidase YedK